MDTKLAEVTLHIDEDTSHDERESFRDVLLAMNGVVAAAYHDERPDFRSQVNCKNRANLVIARRLLLCLRGYTDNRKKGTGKLAAPCPVKDLFCGI